MAEPTPADEIRQAAATLRETATKATPGPWNPDHPWLSDVVTSPLLGSVADCSVGTGYRAQSIQDADWIALVHPGLAEPPAAWLDSAATAYDDLNRAADQVLAGKNHAEAEQIIRRGPYDMQEALAVARAINAKREGL